jgi:hypothetical protein
MLLLVKKISHLAISGITLFPFILIARDDLKNNKTFLNHERIHLRQQLEMLVIPFYVWYVCEYLLLRVRLNHYQAYRNIVFEKEAYVMESDMDYLSKRKFWSFMRFYR